MRNIWLALIPTIFTSIILSGIATYYIISKPNYYVLKIISLLCMMTVMIYFAGPYFKDLAKDKTTVVVAKYDGFHRNSKVGTRKVLFLENGHSFELFVPGFAGDVGKLQEGKIYEIEYFNNSKIIKSYRLIE